jgi:hypothetical protein
MINNDDSILIYLTQGYSLVDITQTGDTSNISSKTRNQHRNFETLMQVLGLRAQVITMTQPEILDLTITNSRFGSNFAGKHTIWTFKFGVEHSSVYANASSTYGSLLNDFTNVPIITGLDETAAFTIPTFCSSGPDTNIYFELSKI